MDTIGIEGSKAVIIDNIRQINSSATVVFLDSFTEKELAEYLENLLSVNPFKKEKTPFTPP